MLLIISQAYSKRNVTKENYSLKGRMKEREKDRKNERKKSMKFLDTGPWDGVGGQGSFPQSSFCMEFVPLL